MTWRKKDETDEEHRLRSNAHQRARVAKRGAWVDPELKAAKRRVKARKVDKQIREVLPVPGRRIRWSISRKTAVVAAYQEGKLSKEEAFERYAVSTEELDSWIVRYSIGGKRGLTNRGLQELRRAETSGTS